MENKLALRCSKERESRIYHILPESEWLQACAEGMHKPRSLEAEGFIHCSTKKQALHTAKRYFPKRSDLLLLEIRTTELEDVLKYEGESELFPHLYTPLDLASVIRVHKLYWEGDDRYCCNPPLNPSFQGRQVLFDIDSTLLKGSTAHKEAFREAFLELFELEGGLDSIRPLHGRTDPDLIEEALIRGGVDPERASASLQDCERSLVRHYYRLSLDDTPELLPGVVDLLDSLSEEGFVMGLVTGNLESIAWSKLRSVGIDHYFSHGGFSSDHRDRKELVGIAIEEFGMRGGIEGLKPILIGDAIQDMQAASCHKVFPIGVCTGVYSAEQLKDAGAETTMEDLVQVSALYKTLGLT